MLRGDTDSQDPRPDAIDHQTPVLLLVSFRTPSTHTVSKTREPGSTVRHHGADQKEKHDGQDPHSLMLVYYLVSFACLQADLPGGVQLLAISRGLVYT